MKKSRSILITIIFFFFLVSNANAFREGSTFWYKHASHQELVEHYKKMELDEVCAMWFEVGFWKQKRRTLNRDAIKDALESKGLDRFTCMKLPNI